MVAVKINCNKNNILVKDSSIPPEENNPIMLYMLPNNLKKYKNNIKWLNQTLKKTSESWNCTSTKLVEVEELNLNDCRNVDYDYFVFEFETEEEAFYFKMKYG